MELSYEPCFAFYKASKVFMFWYRFLPAKIHLQSALKLYKDPVIFNLLGVCLMELSDFSNAEKALDEAIKMNSELT